MVIDHIYKWARSQPKKTAIICDDVPINYASFARAIDTSRRFLEPHALPAGRTAITLVNSPLDAWILVLALRSLGLNTIHVKSIAAAEHLKLRHVACVVVTQSEFDSHKLQAKTLAGINVIIVPTPIYADIHTGELPPIQPNAGPFGGHIIYTSGTTGWSKKLLLDSAFEDQRNEAWTRMYLFSKDTISYGAVGVSSGVGFKSPSAVWHVGGCVVYDLRPDPFQRFFRHGVNSATLTPQMLKSLVQSLKASGPHYDDCELFISAGFLSIMLAEAAITRLTKRLGVTYGASELGAPPLLSRFAATNDMHWLSAAEDRVIQIVDEMGNECSEGELRILLADIDCRSYLDDEKTSVKVFRAGYFYPGDMAVRRADGRIRILGRVDDVLNVQGRKHAVAPIEHAIQHQLGVDEVCVFSGLNATGHEELGIVIQSSRQLSRSELDSITRWFPSFSRVRFMVLNEFPRTDTGTQKTRRSMLRKLVFGETPQSS
jgi:acyl-coenzyme A synthetase/AMP-(fatty) acid ligase